MKILGSIIRIISIDVFNDLFAPNNFNDELQSKVYNKDLFIHSLKAEWIEESKRLYNKWLDKFVNIVYSL